jgi:hypothetical protein
MYATISATTTNISVQYFVKMLGNNEHLAERQVLREEQPMNQAESVTYRARSPRCYIFKTEGQNLEQSEIE